MNALIMLTVFVAATLGCVDKYDRCSDYQKYQCSHSWLKSNCKQYCGFCDETVTPVYTTKAPSCVDKYDRCSDYQKYQCSHSWLKSNCKQYCGLCNETVTPVHTTRSPVQRNSTRAPSCVDNYDRCSDYQKYQCSHSWLKSNCKQYCGLCNETVTPVYTTRSPVQRNSTKAPNCVDKISYCSKYHKRYCSTNRWMKSNCKSYCGLCNNTTTQSSTPIYTTATTATANTPVTNNTRTCGRPQVAQSRVVGGKTANPHSWPWQIALHRSGGFICGGSVINSRWIVTAAHCVYRRSAKYFTVKLGDHNRQIDEGEQTIQVSRVITHPGYGRLNNDIALLELAKPVMFGKHVQPICLPKYGEKPAIGSTCYITGWGKIRHPGSSTTILQQLGLKIQPKDKCSRMNSKYAPITDQMICAANTDVSANQSGCHGDSGGPFVCQNGDQSWTLHGAVSWGSPRCDIKDSFTVFARVAEFRKWIDSYVN